MTEVITDPTPPILHGPSDKEKKYDRQLRLWAASGQQALEDADLLLLNSGSGTVGVETLKNLVLPGIGKFTIADGAVVEECDLGVNFFLDDECLGRARSQCCVQLLQELNPDVHGEWFPTQKGDTLEQLLGRRKFTLILYTLPIDPNTLALIQKYSIEHKIPFISIHSAGFYSCFQTHLPGTFPIIDTHPDSTATTDLRLLSPWPELSKFTSALTDNIDNLSAHDHGHIPYIALLLYYLKVWKEEHGGYPTTYKEKTAFKNLVSVGTRTDNPEGGEENFEEAVAAVMKTISAPSLPSSVREVFDYVPNELEATSSFWIIADAIKKFYRMYQQLPLPGSVPDMKAQSTVYVELQNIYKAKARRDAMEVLEIVRKNPNGDKIDKAEVENFCKNTAFVKLIHKTSQEPDNLLRVAKHQTENDEQAPLTLMPLSLFPIYLALNATRHVTSMSSSDILTSIETLLPGSASNVRIQMICQEVARAKGGELHNISALTGGMVAQEVIKIVTKQYIPINNICIFDGITSRSQILRI